MLWNRSLEKREVGVAMLDLKSLLGLVLIACVNPRVILVGMLICRLGTLTGDINKGLVSSCFCPATEYCLIVNY